MIRKKLMTAAVAGGLLAAAAVPASALENEFHGMYRVMGYISNFQGPTGQGFYAPEEDARVTRFVSQRARIYYSAKVSDDLKLVTKFEIDSRWGDDSYSVGRNKGGALGADQVNIETKNVYLDFNIPSTRVNAKVGIQGYDDVFKGVFVGADMAGALFTSTYTNGEAQLGLFRFNEGFIEDGDTYKTDPTGKRTREMVSLTGSHKIGADSRIGGGYYLVLDDRAKNDPKGIDRDHFDEQIHTIGVNGETKIGKATIDGFLVYQTGSVENKFLQAFAANVGGRIPVGPGTLRSEFLYASGESNEESGSRVNAFQAIDDEHGFYNGEMMILMRDKYAMTIDNAIVYTTNNQNKGVIGGFVGYDLPVTDKFSASFNTGFAAAAKTEKGKGQYLGSEFNTELNYKIHPNLTAILRGAYVVLGDFYDGEGPNGKDPANPWTSNLMLNFTF